MHTFIDIHTHKIVENQRVLQLRNVFPSDEIPQKPYSIGIHPWHISENWETQWQKVEEKAKNPNCLAIGECGLDATVSTPLELQEQIFERHILLANTLQKPLVIHCVKAYEELLKILEKATIPVILHDFGKSAELGRQLQQKGIFLSVGKAVFRPSFEAVLPQLDRSQLFLETDDMERSIEEVYEQVARIFKCNVLTLHRQIEDNFKKVF